MVNKRECPNILGIIIIALPTNIIAPDIPINFPNFSAAIKAPFISLDANL